MQPFAPNHANRLAISDAVEENRDQFAENSSELSAVEDCAQVEEDAVQMLRNETGLQGTPRISRNILRARRSRILSSKIGRIRKELLGIPRSDIGPEVLKAAIKKHGLQCRIYKDDENKTKFEIDDIVVLSHEFVIKDTSIIKDDAENAVADAFANGGPITISPNTNTYDPLGFGGRGPHLTYGCFLKRRLTQAAQYLPPGLVTKYALETALMRVNLKLTLEITRLKLFKKRVELKAGGLILALKYLKNGDCLEFTSEAAIQEMIEEVGKTIRKDPIRLHQRRGMPIELIHYFEPINDPSFQSVPDEYD